MKIEEIVNMPAGREMDALIAGVMGFRQLPVNFFPSTGLDDAFDVLEKMREMGHEWYLSSDPFGVEFTCSIVDDNGEPEESHSITILGSYTSSTIPLAICLAVLLAVNEIPK